MTRDENTCREDLSAFEASRERVRVLEAERKAAEAEEDSRHDDAKPGRPKGGRREAARRAGMGEISRDLPTTPGPGRGKKKTPNAGGLLSKGEVLEKAGISTQDASRCEKIAGIKPDLFEARIAAAKAKKHAITGAEVISGVLREKRHAAAREGAGPRRRRPGGPRRASGARAWSRCARAGGGVGAAADGDVTSRPTCSM